MGYIGKVPADVLIDPHVDSASIVDSTIVTADIANDAVTSAKLAANSVDSSELIDGSVDNSHLAGSIAINKTLLAGGTGLTLSTNTLNVDAAQTQITSVGTIGTGVWQGTKVASAYLDDDTAHLSGSTFTGTVSLGDLDIIPTSSNVSVIKHDSGSGSLTLQGDQVNIKNRAADETGLSYNDGGGVTFPNNVIIGGENATPEVELFYNHSNGSDYKAYLQLAGNDLEVRSSSGTMEFYTGAVDGTSSTERMRITAGGYVGIQTVDNSGDYTAQTISAPLHVLQKTASQTYGLVVQGNSNANGGRIGIGEADSNFTTRANVIDIGFDSSTDFIWSRTGKEMLIGVDNSEKVRIKTSATIFSGDNLVGIGQGTPTSSPLEVNLTQTNATVGSSGFAHFGIS